MTVPYLPLEIVEEIIDVLAGNVPSLRTCSLVSTSWIHRSRRHLFASIKLHSLLDIQSWFKTGLGPSSNHVRSLDLTQDEESRWITPDSLAGIYNDFTAFHNVGSLALTDLDLTLFDEHSLTRFFGHFSENLTSLSVKGMTVHPDALLFFVCMFPKLDDLKLDYLTVGKATIPFRQPVVTPRFRGQFMLSNIKANGTSIIASFVDPPLPMAFKDVSVVDCRFETPKPLKDLFVACQETMRKIKVSKIFLGEFYPRGSSQQCHTSPESYPFNIPLRRHNPNTTHRFVTVQGSRRDATQSHPAPTTESLDRTNPPNRHLRSDPQDHVRDGFPHNSRRCRFRDQYFELVKTGRDLPQNGQYP